MPEPQTRTVLVAPERLTGWLERFAASHGELEVTASEQTLQVRSTDGSTARCEVPFPPLAFDRQTPWQALVEHAQRDRRFGVLLIRRGGYATGVFDSGRLIASKVGSRYVQGRTAAGGQSQQRFARRRENQAAALVGAAVQVAAGILGPHVATLAALATGGDRPLIAAVLADPRLTELAALPRTPWLAVADPRQNVLVEAGRSVRAVRITVTDG